MSASRSVPLSMVLSVLLTVSAAVVLGACSGGAATDAVSGSTSSTTASPPLRGARYCEVLLVEPIDGKPGAEVFNTYPLNECPEDVWTTLDPAAIATSRGVPLAVLNGPRYWLMDEIESAAGPSEKPISFGGIEMIKRATVDLGTIGVSDPPYTPHLVDRKTVFGYAAGSKVHQLVAADGSVYVMQSWSQQVDPTLDEAGLDVLGARLRLPAGWTYRTLTLTEELRIVTTDTDAVALQDELKNTYSKFVAR